MPAKEIGIEEIDDLAAGCWFLGSGGGGDPYSFVLALKRLLGEKGRVRLVDASDLEPDALVANVGFVGSPLVLKEKLFTEAQITTALEEMSRLQGRPIDAVLAAEIGGGNGLVPLLVAAILGVPVVDADGMGRAFPMSDHVSYAIRGLSASPTISVGAKGDIVQITSASNRRAEDLVRATSVVMGNACFVTDYPLSGQQVVETAVLGTVSLAREIGIVLRAHDGDDQRSMRSLQSVVRSRDERACEEVFAGKVVSIAQETKSGFAFGTVVVESMDNRKADVTIEFQNEFLIAQTGDAVIATTPDIISIIDEDSFENLGSDAIRYGQRVRVICMQSDPRMSSELALGTVGPRAFGYDVDYIPIGTPRSGGYKP